MLDAIRKRATSIVAFGLISLLILSFVVWGIGDLFRVRVADVVAEVGGVDISPDRLGNEFQRELNRLGSQSGIQMTREQGRSFGLLESVLNTMIDRTLYGLGASDLGVAISDDLIAKDIRAKPEFRNQLGTFDSNQFYQVLRSNGFSEGTYVALLRDDLARGQYMDSIRAGGVAPGALVEAVYRHRQERRRADVIKVADKSMTLGREPGESDLAAFHKDNPAPFTAPEYRKLTAVILDAGELAREIAVSDDELADAYQQRDTEFQQPERRRLRQMVLAEEADAKRALGLLDEGRDFAEVAKEVSGADALDLGLVGRARLLPEMADAAFSLAEGAYSQPFESPLGWHLVMVSGIEEATVQTLDQVRDKLRVDVAREKAIDGLFSLANQLEDQLGGGSTLEEAAGRLNLRLLRIDAADRLGLDAFGNPVTGLPPGNVFLDSAFRTSEGEESPLMETGTDGYFIVRVDGVTTPALRPLNAVRADVTAAWKAERRASAADTAAQALLEKIKGGAGLAESAKGYKVSKPEPFTRRTVNAEQGLTPELVSGVFAIKPGEAVMARGIGGVYVARLEEILPANPLSDSEGLKSLETQLTRSVQADLLTQLAGALRERYPVSVNTRVIEQNF
jgi:peptidyl-prolyl cis-trans isomerase D